MKWRLVTNFALFQGAWFSAFFLKDDAVLLLALTALVMFLLSQDKRADLCALAMLPIAWTIEYSAVSFGLLSYSRDIPLWLMLLWACLLLTLNHSLLFLTRLTLPSVFAVCASVAPFSYYAGALNNALDIKLPFWQFFVVFGALWSGGFVSIVVINNRLTCVLKKYRNKPGAYYE